MKKTILITLGLIASSTMVSGQAPFRGLLGERYLGLDGGWERLENGVSDDGWGAGAELNMAAPIGPQARLATDLNARFDYMDVLDSDMMNARGILRGYMLPRQGVTPFVGAGFGWIDFDAFDSTYAPVEAGVEFAFGPLALVPFARYSFAFDSAVEDFWTAGATAVYWMATGWGLTASFTYTDYDEIGGAEVIDRGMGARVGLVFSY